MINTYVRSSTTTIQLMTFGRVPRTTNPNNAFTSFVAMMTTHFSTNAKSLKANPHLTIPATNFIASTSTITNTTSIASNASLVAVHNFVSHGILPYTEGWAWQQTLLLQRLAFQRNQQTQQQHKYTHMNSKEDDTLITQTNYKEKDESRNMNRLDDTHCSKDQDCLLFFQHEPIYTLGRGANESNISFLNTAAPNKHNSHGGEIINDESRLRLSRKARGNGSARLGIDTPKQIMDLDTPIAVQKVMDQISNNCKPVMAPNNVPIVRIERGGEVTFHGPGQLVVYPLINLKRDPYKQDLHWYLRMVEEVIIEILRHYNIVGERDGDNTGVWVNDKKIAAVGVSASKWITTHGFAINVFPDLSFFDTSIIIPCGIVGKGVTSIAEVMKERGACKEDSCPTLEEVASITELSFERVFGVKASGKER